MGAKDELWLTVAHLPPQSASFSPASWELRHLCEASIRDRLQDGSSALDDYSKDDGNNGSHPWPSDQTRIPPSIYGSPFQLISVRESELVSRCMLALQGVPVAVTELQLLARVLAHQAADRSLHRLSTLWQRSASSKAIGKLLSVMAQAGRVRCQLEEFVDYFLRPLCISTTGGLVSEKKNQLDQQQRKRRKKKTKLTSKASSLKDEDLNLSPPFSLVNQAFAKAVKSILQGHLAALNMLTTSVLHRRLLDSSNSLSCTLQNEHTGAVIGLSSGEVTLLELHLHTVDLRVQLQVLASLCLHSPTQGRLRIQNSEDNGDWPVEGDLAIVDASFFSHISDFSKFFKGADLLTFLYHQLKEADTVHVEVLQYLFSCACQPYLMFIQSWLYSATVKDPYKEFIVDDVLAVIGSGSLYQLEKVHPFTSLKVEEAVSVPCFLKEVCTSLLRAGHQLQVLLKLVETCCFAEATFRLESSSCHEGLGMLEDALKCWTDLSSENSVFSLALVFQKEKLEKLIEERKSKRQDLMQKFDELFAKLASGYKLQEFSESNITRNKLGLGSTNLSPEKDVYQDKCLESLQGGCQPAELETPRFSAPLERSCEQNLGCNEEAALARSGQPALGGKEDSHEVTLPSISRLIFDGPARKERRRWTEPFDATVVHGVFEGDVLTAEDDDVGMGHFGCSYLSDHSNEMSQVYDTSLSYLPSTCLNCDVAHQGFKAICSVIGTDCSCGGLLRKAYDKSSNSLSLQSSRGYGGHYDLFSFSLLESTPEKIGPDVFFGRSFLRKLGQAYGCKGSEMGQSTSYTKSVLNFDVVCQEFMSFEAGLSDATFDLRLMPVFSCANTLKRMQNLDTTHCDGVLDNRGGIADLNCESANEQRSKTTVTNTMPSWHGISQHQSAYFVENALDTAEQSLFFDNVENVSMAKSNHSDIGKKSELPFGGSSWESYLMGTEEQNPPEAPEPEEGDLEKFEIPLEVVVDKCIVQEVLSQYQCISYFTVRLLHEMFGLQQHLAALRQYFFMARGDWADNFTAALYRHAWYPTESQQRQSEVQAILETALQNSSCENDDYAQRLHVCIAGYEHQSDKDSVLDEASVAHIYLNKSCISAFDFIMLGYKVEWPISLILTSESFKLYNTIFSFLIRSKLTAHALNDIWRYLKDTLHKGKRDIKDQSWQGREDKRRLLVLFRHQVAHFITTLQGYIESQLLHITWSRFLHALNEEAKDLQDLEAIHKGYLMEGLQECFLSNDMKPVKVCIDDIMQCLLSLGNCISCSERYAENGQFDLSNNKIYSRVLEAKAQFERSMLRLYRLSGDSHVRRSLGSFWTRLDFNGFFGDVVSKVDNES